jgi:hypothetical protein
MNRGAGHLLKGTIMLNIKQKLGAVEVMAIISGLDAAITIYIVYLLYSDGKCIDWLLSGYSDSLDALIVWMPKLNHMKYDFIENGYGNRVHVVMPIYVMHMAFYLVGLLVSFPLVNVTCRKLKMHMVEYPTFSEERMISLIGLVSVFSVFGPLNEFMFYIDDINSEMTSMSNLVYKSNYYLLYPIFVWFLSGVGSIFIIIRLKWKNCPVR